MDIKVEKWNGHEIRFVWHNGEWWAVAKDVAEALGYRDSERMTRYLDDKEKATFNWKKKQTPQLGDSFSDYKYKAEVPIISELGIYEAIFNSRRPEAKEFKAWVKRVLKELREQSGLEGFQVFRMMDKEHQKKAMSMIKETLGVRAERKHYIKANAVANKAVSNKYGFPKSIQKSDMTPEMLKDRQPILEEAAQLTAIKEAFGLDFSVAQAIYKKWSE